MTEERRALGTVGQGLRFGGAAGILAVLALHAAHKVSVGESLQEMLWGCHVASLLIALGLLARRPALVATGFLFQLGIGLPAYLLDAFTSMSTPPTSALAHLVPTAVGALSVRRAGLPWRTIAWAWLFFLAVQGLAYLVTDPRLNVNVAFGAWGGMAKLTPTPWSARLFNDLASLPCLAVAAWLGRLALAGRPRPLRAAGPAD